jgi:hypothetical protein
VDDEDEDEDLTLIQHHALPRAPEIRSRLVGPRPPCTADAAESDVDWVSSPSWLFLSRDMM